MVCVYNYAVYDDNAMQIFAVSMKVAVSQKMKNVMFYWRRSSALELHALMIAGDEVCVENTRFTANFMVELRGLAYQFAC